MTIFAFLVVQLVLLLLTTNPPSPCNAFLPVVVVPSSYSKRSSTCPLFQEYVPPPQKRGAPQGGEMAYIESNIQRQMNTYAAIRQVGGLDCIRDVYVCASPTTTTFWYVGKVALAGVTEEQSVARQLNLIEEHATRLRPVELGRAFGTISVYTAPGDSESQVAANVQSLKLMPRYAEGCETVSPKECGFFCEVVTNMGIGFSVERAPDGSIL